jgi:hypothetical protein
MGQKSKNPARQKVIGGGVGNAQLGGQSKKKSKPHPDFHQAGLPPRIIGRRCSVQTCREETNANELLRALTKRLVAIGFRRATEGPKFDGGAN